MGSRSRPRGRNDPEGDRRSEGQAGEGSEIASLGRRLRSAGSTWGGFILTVDETDSTNTLAIALARRGAPHGSLVLAKAQTAGRGRWGRKWESIEGGLYLSLVIRPQPGDAQDLGVLPLLISVAAAEALRDAVGVATDLRWPNDLLFAGRKIGGILCESSFMGSRCEFAVAGVGVNVNQETSDFTEELSSRAGSLRAILGRPLPPLELALAIALAIERWWERERPGRVLPRWRELSAGFVEAPIRVVTREGSAYDASVVGVADDGGLEVRLADGTRRVLHSEEVHLQLAEENYYAEVESYFVGRRGSSLFITPSEWDLVSRWEQEGIPLAVVKEGIDRVFDRPKTRLKPRRLGYCRQTVEAAFRRFRESSLGRSASTSEETSGTEGRLTEILVRLRGLAVQGSAREREAALFLDRAADAVQSLLGRSPEAAVEVERELAEIDGKLVDECDAVLVDEARAELKREAERTLESYRDRMPEKVYRAALESAYRRRIRKKFGLPTLSLYI